MNIVSTMTEKRTIGDRKIDTTRIKLDGAITEEDIASLKDQYGEIFEYFIVLYHPPVDVVEAVQEAVAEKEQIISTIIDYLPDEVAVEYVDIFPEIKLDGSTIKAGTRVRFNGTLYRASVDLLDNEQNTPMAAPNVWNAITAVGEILDWVSGTLYSKDTKVNHSGKVWVSMVDNNSYEPGAIGVYDNIWKEVTT